MSFLKAHYIQIALALLALFCVANTYLVLKLGQRVVNDEQQIANVLNVHENALKQIYQAMQSSPM
jgi:hypothetical protein